MNNSLTRKTVALIILVLSAMAASYAIPRAKYQSTDVLKSLSLPNQAGSWSGRDVAQQVNLGQNDYFFINSVKTKQYLTSQGSIYFTLIDAGNFHHPKVCFQSGGFSVEDLPDIQFETPRGKFSAPVLFFKKEKEGLLIVYWICIDGKRVNWTEQKIKDFWYSLLGKKKTGLIARLDIPVDQKNINVALIFAQDLVRRISSAMPSAEARFVFGE